MQSSLRYTCSLLLSTTRRPARLFASTSSSFQAAGTPWFVDPTPEPSPRYGQRPLPPHVQLQHGASALLPVPDDAPDVLKSLHSELAKSPHLDLAQLTVSPAILPPPGPPLPLRAPHGRRKRGGTYAGESAFDSMGGGIWDWVVIAQVKEGTENRGAIDSVVRLVRKTLLTREPPVPLAPKSRHARGTEWVLIDAGSFAIHILSKASRERYFNQVSW
ncbi:hypothetical protein JR316_0003807 [Psilocybe cubensis]|uniref:Uncharacterized protein n=2 Tax=Psilocybe cubensis TaxID=181762 RepID=A0ACB8H8T8_PSICU|nr:hypothetical protein JR316_0003807 [Psilocybe cubensis]KAH9484326.1 hypothetical protein JR316_0003807 [Psilocybe cubensis]